MPKKFATLPSVNDALQSTRDFMFRGNTNGQHGSYDQTTDGDRELAAQFNTKEELELARQQRKQAGLT